MPLAAPLILPFAELAGITIAGLGMAAASQKVSDFISENPEISMEILTTLVPGGVGLNALFKDKDAPSTKDIVLGELGKEKGNYSSPDAEGNYSSKRGRIIKALEEAGKIKKGPDKDYDSSKKYKDYKKFYEKADGGAIGVEALFTDKKPRKNFSTGGDEQRKIADDEYYASLQNIIERDPGAKEFFNPDDITYPAMDKSGNYNYKGVQVQTDDLDKFKKYAEKRGLDQILSPESTFEEKIKEGQYPVGIFERPVETGTEPMDLRKMQTILHEARHKIMMKPEFKKIMDKYLLKEETFVRYLDKEFFPELDAYLPDFVNPEEADKTYKKAVKEYKDKFTKEDKGFINRLKNLFADGGAIGIEVLFEEKKDGGRIGFANGGIENIIGKNLDNITNVAKGLDKEMLDMTFDDKYYRDVIQPAKLGQRPIPSRMEMMAQNLKTGGPFKAMFIGAQPGKYGERAMPTKPAQQFLNTLGKGAKFVGTKVGPLSFMDLFASTPLGADDEVTDEMRQSIEVTPTSPVRADYERAPNAAFAELLSQPGIADDDFEEMLAEATKQGQRQSFLSQVADYLPFGSKSLTGNIARGVGSMFRNIAPASYGTSGRAFNALTPQGQAAVGSIYGQGGIMQGYNPVSAFGRGPIGAIDYRISKIQNRKAPQTAASKQKIKDLIEARNKITGTGSGSGSGFGKTGKGRDTTVQMTGRTNPKSNPVNQYDSSPASSGEGGKIVCTMMNESYGFGNFRNKIWLRHSRDLPKEYEIGYHTIFLPLVKFAKGEGKLNKVVKKTLEHIARHRTLDLKQEMKGKTHALGRVYRKILEPICLMVGKIKKAVK